jgi:hypothetical protein
MPMLYNEMINECAKYDCGLVGTPFPLPDFEDSMPNKLFEYVAAGIPSIVINSPEAAKFVEENGLGLSVQDASMVPEAMERLKGDCNVKQDRWRFTMETEMPGLLELYGSLCGKSERVISQI